jgi:peptidoglycan/xylan/chitin deacetylase (PgdA/CDA1 family)
MYHGIDDARGNHIHPYYETTTSPITFAEQIMFLKKQEYQIVTLNDLPRIFDNMNELSNTKYAVITFDDGLLNFYNNAYPILDSKGFSAIVYLPSGLIEKENKNIKYMSWLQLLDLRKKGIVFGSHSHSHPELIKLDPKSIRFEILGSKKVIEKQLNIIVESFSYPFAFPINDFKFVNQYVNTLKTFGYKTGVTTLLGRCSRNDYPFLIKRIPINTYDDKSLFAAKLEGGYDWVYQLQFRYKAIKGKKKHQAITSVS